MSNDFGALTILAPKCQKCPKVETCDHKQLAHLGYIIPIEVHWHQYGGPKR